MQTPCLRCCGQAYSGFGSLGERLGFVEQRPWPLYVVVGQPAAQKCCEGCMATEHSAHGEADHFMLGSWLGIGSGESLAPAA